jgi:ATP-binding cassette subfamily B protein
MSDSYFDTDDVTKEYDSRIMRRILSYLKPYKRYAIITLAALVVSTLGELVNPVILQRVIDNGILVKNINYLMYGSGIYLLALTVVFAFTFLQTWTANLMTQRIMKDMRLTLFEKTISQSTAFLSRHPVGRIVTRLTGDVGTIDEFFTSVLIAFLKDIAVMAGTLVTLFLLSPKLAILVLNYTAARNGCNIDQLC